MSCRRRALSGPGRRWRAERRAGAQGRYLPRSLAALRRLPEQAGLNPVLVLTVGHAFVGVWLQDDDFAIATVDDMQLLRKRRDLQDLVFVETTLLTPEPPATFKVATTQGGVQVEDEAPAALEIAIDVRRCRRRGIRPMDLGDGKPTGIAPAPTIPLNQTLSAPPSFEEEARAPVDEAP